MKLYLQLILALTLCLFSCSGDCDLGYEGDGCNTEVRQKFLGAWTSADYNCDLGNSETTKTYEIVSGTVINEVEITTPTTPDLILKGTVLGTSLTIAPQDFVFGVDVTYSGQGTIVGDSLNLEILQDSDGLVRTCTGTYSK